VHNLHIPLSTEKQVLVATDDDKDWFAANPHRRCAPLISEMLMMWRGNPSLASAILVKQVQPGMRVRASVNLDTPLCMVNTDERSARRMWKQLFRGI
jgi:hypothetical protein